MRILAFILIFICAGCAGPVQRPTSNVQSGAANAIIMPLVPTAASLVQRPASSVQRVVAPPSLFQVLSWRPNYSAQYPSEVTVIVESPDLTVPYSAWPRVFVGATNTCTLLRTGPQMFYAAYNTTNQP